MAVPGLLLLLPLVLAGSMSDEGELLLHSGLVSTMPLCSGRARERTRESVSPVADLRRDLQIQPAVRSPAASAGCGTLAHLGLPLAASLHLISGQGAAHFGLGGAGRVEDVVRVFEITACGWGGTGVCNQRVQRPLSTMACAKERTPAVAP